MTSVPPGRSVSLASFSHVRQQYDTISDDVYLYEMSLVTSVVPKMLCFSCSLRLYWRTPLALNVFCPLLFMVSSTTLSVFRLCSNR